MCGLLTDLKEATEKMDCLVLCTPSKAVEQMVEAMAPWVKKDAVVVCASKGLAAGTGRCLSTVISEKLQGITDNIVALSGPNHAEEIGKGLPAATVVASEKENAARFVQDIYMSPKLRVYRSNDILGVEYGGALKNIIAIASGVQDGLGLGDNCKAALITRGLAEIQRWCCFWRQGGYILWPFRCRRSDSDLYQQPQQKLQCRAETGGRNDQGTDYRRDTHGGGRIPDDGNCLSYGEKIWYFHADYRRNLPPHAWTAYSGRSSGMPDDPG